MSDKTPFLSRSLCERKESLETVLFAKKAFEEVSLDVIFIKDTKDDLCTFYWVGN